MLQETRQVGREEVSVNDRIMRMRVQHGLDARMEGRETREEREYNGRRTDRLDVTEKEEVNRQP